MTIGRVSRFKAAIEHYGRLGFAAWPWYSQRADRIGGPAVYTPFIIFLAIIVVLFILAVSLNNPKRAGSMLGTILVLGMAGTIAIFGVTWFLSGESLRSLLN